MVMVILHFAPSKFVMVANMQIGPSFTFDFCQVHSKFKYGHAIYDFGVVFSKVLDGDICFTN